MHFVQYLSVTHFTRNVVITFPMYARLIRCVTDDKDDLRTRNVIECSFVCNYISHTAMRKLQYRTYRAVSNYRMTYRVLQMTREAISVLIRRHLISHRTPPRLTNNVVSSHNSYGIHALEMRYAGEQCLI